MEGARRRFLGNGNYQQGTAIIIKIFWRGTRIYANGTLIKENWSARRTRLGNRHCEADELANNDQQGTAIKINILVEEREFMRMERDCEADEHL